MNEKKIISKKLIGKVWQWNLFSLKRKDKKWDYACLVKGNDCYKVSWTVSIGIDKKWKIVLIKNYRHAVDRVSWEFVLWWLEEGLTEEENAIKEFWEEAHIYDKPITTKKLWALSMDTGIFGNYISFILLEYEDFSKYDVFWKRDIIKEDIYEVQYFSKEEVENIIKSGKMISGIAVAAYGLLKANKII